MNSLGSHFELKRYDVIPTRPEKMAERTLLDYFMPKSKSVQGSVSTADDTD